MNTLSGPCFLIAVLCAFGCRPEPDGQLQIQVHAQHADAETVAPNIQLTLARRVLADGILNGNYETVAQHTNRWLRLRRIELSAGQRAWIINSPLPDSIGFLWKSPSTPMSLSTSKVLALDHERHAAEPTSSFD